MDMNNIKEDTLRKFFLGCTTNVTHFPLYTNKLTLLPVYILVGPKIISTHVGYAKIRLLESLRFTR